MQRWHPKLQDNQKIVDLINSKTDVFVKGSLEMECFTSGTRKVLSKTNNDDVPVFVLGRFQAPNETQIMEALSYLDFHENIVVKAFPEKKYTMLMLLPRQ